MSFSYDSRRMSLRMGSCSQPLLVAWMKPDLMREVSFRSCEPVIE